MATRHCECGRELEKYCRVCSECRVVNAQICKDVYASTDEGVQAQDRYNKTEKGKAVRLKANRKWRQRNIDSEKHRKIIWNMENKDHVKQYNKDYYKKRKQVHI